MKTYRLKDGGTIAASSPGEFVTKMRESSKFDSECTDDEYMVHFAERYQTQTGETIKTDDPATFLAELIRTRFIE